MNSLYFLLFRSPILSNPRTISVFFIFVDQDPIPLQLLLPEVKYPNAALQVPEPFDKFPSTIIFTITPSERTSRPAAVPLITSILIIASAFILSKVLIILLLFEDCLSPLIKIWVPDDPKPRFLLLLPGS